MTSAQSEAGFSLVEILVATAVFAVVGVISVALLSTTITAQEVNDNALARINALDRARVLLREDIGQVVQRSARAEDGAVRPALFAGDANGLADRFAEDGDEVILSLTRRGRSNPGLVRARSSLIHVQYVLRDGQLIRRVSEHPDITPLTRWAEQVILQGADEVELGFMVGSVWQSRLATRPGQEGASLPRAVRLRLTTTQWGALEFLALTSEVRL
ncbi:type II secretion system minor pseudopilin GspJ [Maricaulis sp.]|uniref:type II secretion system minor pseudopilin GspJ n=1 Tax=Maricaulis sp. TaxID=1486257 RepID=UPI001B12A02F|nr:type II secretion system minor pseudopilin GspJ [Maricaulis sp.]MBO6796162.1 type II secretion system minor pseudopilin GspJ [Maricaulis sp.]